MSQTSRKKLSLDVSRHVAASLLTSVLGLQKIVASLSSYDAFALQHDLWMTLAIVDSTVARISQASAALQSSIIADASSTVAALSQALCMLLKQLLASRCLQDMEPQSAIVIKVTDLVRHMATVPAWKDAITNPCRTSEVTSTSLLDCMSTLQVIGSTHLVPTPPAPHLQTAQHTSRPENLRVRTFTTSMVAHQLAEVHTDITMTLKAAGTLYATAPLPQETADLAKYSFPAAAQTGPAGVVSSGTAPARITTVEPITAWPPQPPASAPPAETPPTFRRMDLLAAVAAAEAAAISATRPMGWVAAPHGTVTQALPAAAPPPAIPATSTHIRPAAPLSTTTTSGTPAAGVSTPPELHTMAVLPAALAAAGTSPVSPRPNTPIAAVTLESPMVPPPSVHPTSPPSSRQGQSAEFTFSQPAPGPGTPAATAPPAPVVTPDITPYVPVASSGADSSTLEELKALLGNFGGPAQATAVRNATMTNASAVVPPAHPAPSIAPAAPARSNAGAKSPLAAATRPSTGRNESSPGTIDSPSKTAAAAQSAKEPLNEKASPSKAGSPHSKGQSVPPASGKGPESAATSAAAIPQPSMAAANTALPGVAGTHANNQPQGAQTAGQGPGQAHAHGNQSPKGGSASHKPEVPTASPGAAAVSSPAQAVIKAEGGRASEPPSKVPSTESKGEALTKTAAGGPDSASKPKGMPADRHAVAGSSSLSSEVTKPGATHPAPADSLVPQLGHHGTGTASTAASARELPAGKAAAIGDGSGSAAAAATTTMLPGRSQSTAPQVASVVPAAPAVSTPPATASSSASSLPPAAPASAGNPPPAAASASTASASAGLSAASATPAKPAASACADGPTASTQASSTASQAQASQMPAQGATSSPQPAIAAVGTPGLKKGDPTASASPAAPAAAVTTHSNPKQSSVSAPNPTTPQPTALLASPPSATAATANQSQPNIAGVAQPLGFHAGAATPKEPMPQAGSASPLAGKSTTSASPVVGAAASGPAATAAVPVPPTTTINTTSGNTSLSSTTVK